MDILEIPEMLGNLGGRNFKIHMVFQAFGVQKIRFSHTYTSICSLVWVNMLQLTYITHRILGQVVKKAVSSGSGREHLGTQMLCGL